MVQVRFIADDEVGAFRKACNFGFGGDATDDADKLERFRQIFPVRTCIGAFDGDRMVATFGSFDLDLSVPGPGSLPMAGTTVVTVHPPYRRRGLLSEMMRMHLDQAVERGQSLAGLWASESGIYGRFGYGQAVESIELTLPTDRVTLPPGPDSITLGFIDHDEAAQVLPPLFETVVESRPGMFTRTADWWQARRLADPDEGQEGASTRRFVVAYRDGEPVGYTSYRQKEKWDLGASQGEVLVIELIATDDDTRRSLWHYLAHVDLFPNLNWWIAPVDEPLLVEVNNPRLLTVRRHDTLWIRILDVATALAGRSYEVDDELVIGVHDGFMATTGNYRLSVSGSVGSCEPTDDAADVELDIADLGALYLGGRSARQMHRAGLIDTAGDDPLPTVIRLDRLFATSLAPWCPEVF